LTAAITGLSSVSICLNTLLPFSENSFAEITSSLFNSPISAPATNAFLPLPVITTTNISGLFFIE